MAKVQPPAPRSAATRDTSGLEPRTYKVVYEAITQEKKKLQTGSSFSRHPPPGFTFVLAGNPELTARCKEYSRTEGRQTYTVSTSHKRAGTITQHVCRIGYHFASSIVTRVCNDLGVSITPSGHTRNLRSRDGNSVSASGTKKTVYAKPNNLRNGLRSKRKIHAERDPISQEQLNYEARNALTDLFPKIPEQDLSSIISRAFKKGGKRVGNAHELSLQRRVQLAALAHIRHQYTNYDKLLRTAPRYHARAQVEETCLRLIVQWRGDGGGDENDIEQILREVIVISDDDSDGNNDTGKGNQQHRDSSVEIVSSQTIAPGARKFQISQKLSIGDDHTLELDAIPSRSHENTQIDGERKEHKRPSTKWSSRYRAFRDSYNKQGSQAEAQGQIRRHPLDTERDRNPLEDYSSSPLIQYEVPSDNALESPYPPQQFIKLGSLRDPNLAKGLSANLQGQILDRVDAIGKEIYWEITSPMASPTDRRIAANIQDSEVPRERYNHPNTYGQLSQNYGQDDVLPAIENPWRKLIGSPNKSQREHHSCRIVQHVDQYATKQTGVPPPRKYENRTSISTLQEASSPPSRLWASLDFATLDYGEQPRKRQRSQYEPIAISPQYDAARSGQSSHGHGSDMPKPPRSYTEQSIQRQTPTQIDQQPDQLIRGGEPEYHLRELRAPTGPSKYNSNIHNEIHDRRLFRPSLQGGICPTQLQLPQHEKSAQQPLPRSPNAPCPSGVYRPALIGDDQCAAAWGGHPSHLRLGNNSVYKPQDSSLEGTSFHPYFELRGASSHESRHFVPRHYLNSVDGDDEFHGQSLNFQPESNLPSSHELLRLRPDADTNSWKDGPTLVLPSPRLGKPPANENLWGETRVGQEIRQKKEVKYSHNGSIFGQANVLVPRRSSQAYVLARRPSGTASSIRYAQTELQLLQVEKTATDDVCRSADREWASKSDRYHRESAKHIYVKQPPSNFPVVERNNRSQRDNQGPVSNKEIIVID